MLLKLPQEILIDIARKLEFRDKLTLIQTCQKLNDLILNRCLYVKLPITKDMEDSERIIERFKTKQICSLQVKELWYHMTLLSDDLFVQFPDIFPNVTRYVDITPTFSKQLQKESPINQLLKWKDTLEYYKSTNDWFKAASLMQKYTFSRLSYLHLTCSIGRSNKNDIRRRIQFHDCIKNVPSLKILHLESCIVTLKLLESIHSSCLQLHTFIIQESLYLMENEVLPLTIIPAKRIFHFEIKSLASFVDTNCNFLNYITTKYTNVEQFIFCPITVEGTDVLRVCYPDDFEDQSDTIENSKIATLVKKIELAHSLYRNEATRFLSRLPSTIKKLEFDGDMFDHVPEALEQATVDPIDVNIQQKNHNPSIFDKHGKIGCFKRMSSLKTIQLQLCPSLLSSSNVDFASVSTMKLKAFITKVSDYRDVNIGWILSAFPLLEVLELYSFKNAIFITEDNIQPIHLKLKKLYILLPTIHPKFLDHLAVIAPNIQDLSLYFSDEGVIDISPQQKQQQKSMATQLYGSKIDFTLDLTDFHTLDTFEIFFITNRDTPYDTHTRSDLLYDIKIGNETKRMVFRNCRKVVEIESYRKEIEELPKVTVLFNKIKKFTLHKNAEITQDNHGRITFKEIHVTLRIGRKI